MVLWMNKHWTERMFVEKPALFQTTLESRIEQADLEVTGLINIFSMMGVPEHALLLDLCCGIGRHSVPLAEKGFRVMGVDLSPQYIMRAQELATERAVSENVEFTVGDMRTINAVLNGFSGQFHAVLNLFTSLGYYDEEADTDVFSQLLDLTASQGILVIDTLNRDWMIRHFQARDIVFTGDDSVCLEERNLNLETSRTENTWTYYEKHENDLQFVDAFEWDHRVYSLHELKRLVESSGWTYHAGYGNWNLDPLTMDSQRMIIVAKKLGSGSE
jgi:2-polyprenyl-3-methyl-5-hydroxy-6-metoxy-1,4-benzoquinol methylase